jgi:N utilization substance protein A
MEIVKEIEDDSIQMTLEEAKKITKDVNIGEKIMIDITPDTMELSRIAAQAAAQTIKQSLKGIEREKFFEKFQNKEGELLKAKVIRSQGETVILEAEGTAVVLQPEGQIPHRIYEPNEEIFVYLKQISKGQGGVVLDITQASEEYIEAILKKIVPELEEGLVKIEKIARIPGRKTKIVVSSEEENIDPVGVMVGRKGDRINTVLSLLDGEKIDYIEYTDDEVKLIRDLLKPAKVDHIEITDKKVFVTMAEDQKALAIGK